MDFKKPRQVTKSKFDELDVDETGEEIAVVPGVLDMGKNTLGS